MPERGSLGGPAACEPPFVAELRRLGVRVAEEPYVYGDRLSGTSLRDRVVRVLRTARRLRRRLRAEPFDVVHLNTSFDTKALLRDVVTLLLIGDGRVFLKFHGSDAALLHTRNFVLCFLRRTLLSRADGIGTLSSEERANFIGAGVDERKVFTVKNVVQGPEGGRRGPAFAERVGIEAGVPVLLFIARFIPAKGLLDVIRACRIVRDRGRKFVLLCVGDGPARPEAEAEVAAQGIGASVRFCGFIPEEQTGEFYANSTALVFPTWHYEGFPMVVFNSVAAGTPVITTRIRAAADYLREPDNCLWVEAQNPPALAEKIIHLLDHPEVRESMARNNRELAKQFTAAAVAPEYVAIYNRLIAARQGERAAEPKRSRGGGSSRYRQA